MKLSLVYDLSFLSITYEYADMQYVFLDGRNNKIHYC